MLIGDAVIDGVSRIALVFYTVDKGLRITEIIVDGARVEVDDFSFVKLKKQCMKEYFNDERRALKDASDYRKNPTHD